MSDQTTVPCNVSIPFYILCKDEQKKLAKITVRFMVKFGLYDLFKPRPHCVTTVVRENGSQPYEERFTKLIQDVPRGTLPNIPFSDTFFRVE